MVPRLSLDNEQSMSSMQIVLRQVPIVPLLQSIDISTDMDHHHNQPSSRQHSDNAKPPKQGDRSTSQEKKGKKSTKKDADPPQIDEEAQEALAATQQAKAKKPQAYDKKLLP